MQNTIIKEFADNPNVFVAVFNQGGGVNGAGETREWLEIYWSRNFLRGNLIWDATGAIGGNIYGQPDTDLPFGRGFIIDREGKVVVPFFGHQPQMVINAINELLSVANSCQGDLNNSGNVDISDLAIFTDSFGRDNCNQDSPCKGDFNNDQDVDGSDFSIFVNDFNRTGCLD